MLPFLVSPVPVLPLFVSRNVVLPFVVLPSRPPIRRPRDRARPPIVGPGYDAFPYACSNGPLCWPLPQSSHGGWLKPSPDAPNGSRHDRCAVRSH